jgi:hypothetical protein
LNWCKKKPIKNKITYCLVKKNKILIFSSFNLEKIDTIIKEKEYINKHKYLWNIKYIKKSEITLMYIFTLGFLLVLY